MANFEPRISNSSTNPLMNYDEDNPYTVPKHVRISEEEIARIQEIFKPFDDTGRGKAPIDDFPTIMRLLNYNLTEIQFEELKIQLTNKRNKSMFTFIDLLEILSDNPQFTEDTADDLLSALRELDENGDGMIPVTQMMQFLTSLGEVFTEEESQEFILYALGIKKPFIEGQKNTSVQKQIDQGQIAKLSGQQVDIKKIVEVMMPKLTAMPDPIKSSATNSMDSSSLNISKNESRAHQPSISSIQY